MTAKMKKLRQLCRIAEVKADRGKVELARHLLITRRIEREIDDLPIPKNVLLPKNLDEAAQVAQLLKWSGVRRSELLGKLALSMAQAEPIKETARLDEGRFQVVKKLCEREAKNLARTRD